MSLPLVRRSLSSLLSRPPKPQLRPATSISSSARRSVNMTANMDAVRAQIAEEVKVDLSSLLEPDVSHVHPPR